MKYTFNFLKVISQIALVALAAFVIPAILHALVTMDYINYFVDVNSSDYQVVSSFLAVIVTVVYCIAYGMHMEEVNNS